MGKAESDFSRENPWIEAPAANSTTLGQNMLHRCRITSHDARAALKLLKQGRAHAVIHIGECRIVWI